MNEDNIHIYPVNDLVEHVLEGDGCVCGPTVKYVDPETGESYESPLIVHEALDGRE